MNIAIRREPASNYENPIQLNDNKRKKTHTTSSSVVQFATVKWVTRETLKQQQQKSSSNPACRTVYTGAVHAETNSQTVKTIKFLIRTLTRRN